MSTRFKNYTVLRRADEIVQILKDKGFVIQRYDSYSTSSIYLKLDYGVCNSIRISDHEGKKHLCYRYNMIMGCEDNIVEEKYIRYYFNESNLTGLINQILFDKVMKLKKYGKQAYRSFMLKNMQQHQNDNGFWKDSKLILDEGDTAYRKPRDYYIDSVTGNVVYKSTDSDSSIKLQQMPDGTYACGPEVALNVCSNVISNQMQLDASAKFHENDTIKVIASYDELEAYYMSTGETDRQAKTHALQILGRPGYNIGTNLGATKCDEGMFYTIELPLIPMEFLPEEFLCKA